MDVTPGESAPVIEELGYTADAKCNFSVHAVANKAYLILIGVFSDERRACDQVLHSIEILLLVTHIISIVHIHVLLQVSYGLLCHLELA